MKLLMLKSSKRRQQVYLLIGLLLALCLTIFFGARAFLRFRHRPTDEPIRAWMNIHYVAHSYRVPPTVLFQALGLPDTRPPDNRPIRRLAKDLNLTSDEVIARLAEAIAQERAAHKPPGKPPGEPPPDHPPGEPPLLTPTATPP